MNDVRWHQAPLSSIATCCAGGARGRRRSALRRSCSIGWPRTLADRLAAVLRRFECAVDLGTPTDAVRRRLAAGGKVGTIVAADPLAGTCRPRRRGEGELAVAADEEALPFRDASIDLVVSALALQFVNDLPGTLVQIRRALKPDGLLLAALVGGDTLTELREAFAVAEAEIEDGISPRVAPFADIRDVGALLQRAGFALPVTDVDRLTVRYASPIALMHDLRRMGATNPLSRSPPAPAHARAAPADDGGLWRAILRSRRSHPSDVRDHLALGLGTACQPTAAARARLGAAAARRRARREGNPGWREGRQIAQANTAYSSAAIFS